MVSIMLVSISGGYNKIIKEYLRGNTRVWINLKFIKELKLVWLVQKT